LTKTIWALAAILFVLNTPAMAQKNETFGQAFNRHLNEIKNDGKMPMVDPRLAEAVRARQYVFYPGWGGNAPGDVFTDNARILVEDYWVEPDDIEIRDVEIAYNSPKRLAPKTKVQAEEPIFLKGLYKGSAARNGGKPKPLFLMSHSMHGEELFYIAMAMAKELLPGGMIDRIFFLQSGVSSSNGGDVHMLAQKSPDIINAARTKMIFLETSQPANIGVQLGPVGAGEHIETVISQPRVAKPYSFRQAFMRTVLEFSFADELK